MPRNNILPPVSFVTDLSNSGNSLIQKLFAKPSQSTKDNPALSFSERLRSQSVDSQRDRVSTAVAPKPTRQAREPIKQAERLELLQRKPPENRRAGTVQPHKKTVESQPAAQLSNSVSATQPTVDDKKTVDRLESPDDSIQAASQQPVPVESQNKRQSTETVALQSDKITAAEKSETGDVPATLLKHVVQSTKQNAGLDDIELNSNLSGNENSGDENSQPPLILSGLANALQGQVLPQREDSEEQVPVPSSNEPALKSQRETFAFNSQEQGQEQSDVSSAGIAAISDSDLIEQNFEQSNQSPAESIPQEQIPAEEKTTAQQVSQLNVGTEQVPAQVEPQQSQPTSLNEQEKQHSQNVSKNDSQNKQNESSPEKQIPQGLSPANEMKDSDSVNKQEESSQQQPVSVAVGNGTVQNQNQETAPEAEVISSTAKADLPTDESASKLGDETSQASGSNQKFSASELPAHVAQQYQQDTLQGNSSLKQSLGNHVNRVSETSIVEKLSEAAGAVSIGESSDAAQTQKSVQVDSLSVMTSTSARSSAETPAAVQARPVLDVTRSDMSQKLSSFIQQASESGKAMRIRLDPPELGSLQIEVGRVNGQIVARIEVDNPTARALVFEQLQMLRDSLQQQGLRVDRLEVELNENLSREFTSDQSGNQKSQEQQQRFAEETEFAAENKKQADQSEHEKNAPNSPPPQVVGVSEIDVHV